MFQCADNHIISSIHTHKLHTHAFSLHNAYFRPKGYRFEDVVRSIKTAKKRGVWVSLNYFIFPGFTDTKGEMDALLALLEEIPVDMIQMRNHNIDPDWYWEALGPGAFSEEPVGILQWMKAVKKVRPKLRFGYFNPSL